MSMTDSFLPDPDRRVRDADQELAHEVPGDGPDVIRPESGDASTGDLGTAGEAAEAPQPLHPNLVFRTPRAGERLTADELESDLDD